MTCPVRRSALAALARLKDPSLSGRLPKLVRDPDQATRVRPAREEVRTGEPRDRGQDVHGAPLAERRELLPVSLATALLDYSGWLHQMDFLLRPAMEIMSLPPAAALPILIGLTAGVYGCLAALAVLPLSVEHMTLITVFVLIAHSLPQEGIIQAKSGINFIKTTLVRLAAAVLTCLAVGWCLQPLNGDTAAAVSAAAARVWIISGSSRRNARDA